jgi:replicative DNA helicase
MSNPPLDERALVGALLHLPLSGVAAVRPDFDRDDLDDPRLRIILDLVDDCTNRAVRPDPAVVFATARTSALVPTHQLGELGHLLIELNEEVPLPAAAPIYAAGVVEASVRRRIAEAATRLQQASTSELNAALLVVADECQSLVECSNRLLKGDQL